MSDPSTSVPAVSSVDTADGLTALLKQEWRDWCAAHHPKPASTQTVEQVQVEHRHDRYAAHGMPTGWVEVGRHPYSPNTEMAIFSHPHGHWGLLVSFHADDDTVDSGVMEGFASLTAMYDYAVHSAAMRQDLRAPDAERAQAGLAWVRDLLAAMYDPSIPAEAAEQMLVGLGGRPGLTPRAVPQPRTPPT